MSIENILKRIEEDTEAAIAEIMAKAEEKASGIRNEYARQGTKLREELERRARTKAADEERRLIVAEELELRKALLVRKREILDEIYGEARKRLEGLSAARYRELLKALIVEMSISGKEEIVVPAKQREAFTAEFVESLNKARGPGAAFTLADAPGDFTWGVVLREGSRRVDLTLDVIFEQLKARLESGIARILFPD
jgi:V/A-type H+-transporting ATPase subunit E